MRLAIIHSLNLRMARKTGSFITPIPNPVKDVDVFDRRGHSAFPSMLMEPQTLVNLLKKMYRCRSLQPAGNLKEKHYF